MRQARTSTRAPSTAALGVCADFHSGVSRAGPPREMGLRRVAESRGGPRARSEFSSEPRSGREQDALLLLRERFAREFTRLNEESGQLGQALADETCERLSRSRFHLVGWGVGVFYPIVELVP